MLNVKIFKEDHEVGSRLSMFGVTSAPLHHLHSRRNSYSHSTPKSPEITGVAVSPPVEFLRLAAANATRFVLFPFLRPRPGRFDAPRYLDAVASRTALPVFLALLPGEPDVEAPAEQRPMLGEPLSLHFKVGHRSPLWRSTINGERFSPPANTNLWVFALGAAVLIVGIMAGIIAPPLRSFWI